MSQKHPKKLVHGTLIDVEILTSPVPQVFAQPGQDLDTDALPVAVQALPKWSKMFLCVSANLQKFGAWGPNRCWDIDFPTPMYLLNLAQLSGPNAPSVGVPTPPKWSNNIAMHLRNLQKIWCMWCWDIESPTSPCICSTWPRFGHWYSACGWSQVIWKCSYVSQQPPKKLGAWGLNRCCDIDFPNMYLLKILTSPLPCLYLLNWEIDSPMYLLNFGHWTLPVSVPTPVGVPTPPNRCWDIGLPGQIMGTNALRMGVSQVKCSYVSHKPPKSLGHGALIDAEILTPPCICSTWPRYGHWYLPVGVQTPVV